MSDLTHLDDAGRASMVDVGEKPATARRAVAGCVVRMQAATAEAVRGGSVGKGEVLAVARVAGIMAAKKTGALIPLCHPIGLERVAVEFAWDAADLHVTATASLVGKTGVEMEAMTAASVAALTVYDMVKAIDRGVTIDALRLLEKSGGKSGEWKRVSAEG